MLCYNDRIDVNECGFADLDQVIAVLGEFAFVTTREEVAITIMADSSRRLQATLCDQRYIVRSTQGPDYRLVGLLPHLAVLRCAHLSPCHEVHDARINPGTRVTSSIAHVCLRFRGSAYPRQPSRYEDDR